MGRNWGIPNSSARGALRNVDISKPLLTLLTSAIFGIIGVAIAVISFAGARTIAVGLFNGASLAAAVIAAGAGCWLYVWIARPRFAAQFSGKGDVFHKLLRFYIAAVAALVVLFFAASMASGMLPAIITVFLYCFTGGSAAAAAFQTILAFVPYYDDPNSESGP